MMENDQLEMSDPVRGEDGRVEWSIRTEKDGIGVVTDVGVGADEAREWAVKLLTAAGPSADELVRTWIAGQVRVTVEAPAGNEDVMDPLLSVSPATTEDFERVLAVFGGLTAFEDFSPHATYAQLHLSVPPLGVEGEKLTVMVKPPTSIARSAPIAPGLMELQRRQAEEKAQVEEEQTAADHVTAALIAEHTLTGRLFARLRELGRPVTVEELASVAMCHVDRAREGVRDLVNGGVVQQSEDDPPMLTPSSLVEQLAAPASGGVMADPLAPGPGKDGHGE